jgi:polar amino acid transport system permease protein
MTFWEITLELLGGFAYTLLIFGVTLAAAIPLGLLVAFGSMSKFKPLSYLSRGFVWVIRGTPLMLQIIFFSLGPGLWLGIPIRTTEELLLMVCVAFSINYACYFSEIFRGGIESISKGQHEAGQVLGMTKWQVFRHVVLLQVVKRVIPPMSNEIITLLKDTALANTIAVYELIFEAKEFLTVDGLIWPLFLAGGFYLLFVGLLTIMLGKVEKRLDYFKA